MFTLGIVFVIFSGSLILQQMNGITTTTETLHGAEIVVRSDPTGGNLNENLLRKEVEWLIDQNKVAAYSFVTRPFFMTVSRLSRGQKGFSCNLQQYSH